MGEGGVKPQAGETPVGRRRAEAGVCSAMPPTYRVHFERAGSRGPLVGAGWRVRRARRTAGAAPACARDAPRHLVSRREDPGRSRLQELKGRPAAPQSCWRAALRLGEDAPRRLPRPAHIPSVGIRCGHARRTSSPVQLQALPAITGLLAQLVEAPRLFVHHRPPRPRRRGARAARSSKRLRTCTNSRARFLSAFSELAALVFLRLTGTRRVFPAV
jgi:hypothetical protein